MAKKDDKNIFKELEMQALLAFREWPIWLILREKELQAHLVHVKRTESKPKGERS